MSYGAQEDSKLEAPHSYAVYWIGYDSVYQTEKMHPQHMLTHPDFIITKVKTWFEARQLVAIKLHPESINTLVVRQLTDQEIVFINSIESKDSVLILGA